MKTSIHTLEVWGDLACFTRPELKVERFSYPVITPSAARAVFEAIYWKKTFWWQVTRIEMLKPPRYIALRRNETKDKVPAGSISRWMKGLEAPAPIFTDGDKALLGTDQRGRTQRQTMALKDVAYRLHARMMPWPEYEDSLTCMEVQFKRRAGNGQCFSQPYMGCREFPAYFRLVDPVREPSSPHPVEMDMGLMLYDVFDLGKKGSWDDKPSISLFYARMHAGTLDIPEYASSDVLKCVEGEVM
jgi:CRISPR-associated protein Cas5d